MYLRIEHLYVLMSLPAGAIAHRARTLTVPAAKEFEVRNCMLFCLITFHNLNIILLVFRVI